MFEERIEPDEQLAEPQAHQTDHPRGTASLRRTTSQIWTELRGIVLLVR